MQVILTLETFFICHLKDEIDIDNYTLIVLNDYFLSKKYQSFEEFEFQYYYYYYSKLVYLIFYYAILNDL